MFFNIKPKVYPPDGTERTITKFCWFPTWCTDGWCWLEKVTLVQTGMRMFYEASDWYQWTTIRRLTEAKK